MAAVVQPAPVPNPAANVGIIFPPPDIRGMIDKTASFVAKNGLEFEQRVLREQNNQRFAFLLPNNPYRSYYDLKVKELKAGATETAVPAVPAAILEMRKKEEEQKKKRDEIKMLTMGEKQEELKPPDPDVYSVYHPFINSMDMDIIKVTAQFVARNGQRFLMGLAQREGRNPQFDFLKPTHAFFGYFTSLVESYTKCLMPDQDHLDRLKVYAEGRLKPLERCINRARWDAQEDQKRKDKDAAVEEEKAQMQLIDWHDFVVVETIEFTAEDDNIPLAPPLDFKSLKAGAANAVPAPMDGSLSRPADSSGAPPPSRAAPPTVDKTTIIEADDEMEMEIDDAMDIEGPPSSQAPAASAAEPSKPFEPTPGPQAPLPMPGGAPPMLRGAAEVPGMPGAGPQAAAFQPEGRPETAKSTTEDEAAPAVAPPTEEIPLPAEQPVKVRTDYVRQKRKGVQKMQKCPITGKSIPEEEMTRHLKVLLLDPKWKGEKDRLLEKARKESALAVGDDVESNLAFFVVKRPDLFGSVDDQIQDDL